MEFVAATNNRDKLAELERILQGSGHSVVSMTDADVDVQPEENGESYAENALIKAKAVCAASGRPALADDSGLEVDALAGAPGIHSARFSGLRASAAENNEKLLKLIERFPYAKRTARFKCALAVVLPGGASLVGEGVCEGRIGFVGDGDSGFGYDPLFYPSDKSFASMTDDEKDAISHRALAVRDLLSKLPEFLSQNQNGEGANAETNG